ncbi:MAG: response regulator [Halobacteriota archaeon]|nr:response regulator [Halobacteriota archaeon]
MQGKRVMIVDDEPSILIAVRVLLEPKGFEVVTVDSGMKCIEVLKEGFKGVILMDVMMPRMDGWDTIQKIVDEGLSEGNIIVMFTAKEIPGPKMEGLQEYVMDYITKPFENEKLVASINEYQSYLI